MVSAKRPIYTTGEIFRTDAKCEDGRVVLAGWEVCDDSLKATWFRVALSPDEAPYLFKEGKAQWASTSAELLASFVALFAFGLISESRSRKVIPFSISAGTDNRANDFLSVKRSTTKWPLMLINMQLSHVLASSSLLLNLQWRPREENVLADALTNEDDSSFTPSLRVNVNFRDLPISIIDELWKTKLEFDECKTSFISGEVSRRKRQKTQWWLSVCVLANLHCVTAKVGCRWWHYLVCNKLFTMVVSCGFVALATSILQWTFTCFNHCEEHRWRGPWSPHEKVLFRLSLLRLRCRDVSL